MSRVLVVAACVLACAAVRARAADLDTAWEFFYDADFELALTEIGAIVTDASDGDRLREAHALAGQCHARLGDDTAAMDSFCSALAVEPKWNPDPTAFSVEELALYRRSLTRCPQLAVPETTVDPLPGAPQLADGEEGKSSPWYKKKGFLIGAGALVVLAIAAGSNSDSPAASNDTVPDFPDPPRAPQLGVSW